MQIDYQNTMKIVNIRLKQINEISLEREYFNSEYQALCVIKQELAKLIILERNPETQFVIYEGEPKDQNETTIK